MVNQQEPREDNFALNGVPFHVGAAKPMEQKEPIRSCSIIDRISSVEAKATKRPWQWWVSLRSNQVELSGSPKRGRETVMDFVRWGMSGSAPRFRDANCLMVRADKLAAIVPGREHHQDWYRDVEHPDAQLMVLLRNSWPEVEAVLRAVERFHLTGEMPGELDDAFDALCAVKEADRG